MPRIDPSDRIPDRVDRVPGVQRHVLVVDGDDAALDRSRGLLEEAGYTVSTVDIPDIGMVRRIRPDAVVLGLMFRGQATGLDFLERHAADPVTAPIPVVVHAAESDLGPEQRRRLGLLSSPVVLRGQPAERLLAELRRVLVVPSAALVAARASQEEQLSAGVEG